MKRGDLLRHLQECGCEFIREGSRHSWWWNPEKNRRSAKNTVAMPTSKASRILDL
jgi:hypothetical protein